MRFEVAVVAKIKIFTLFSMRIVGKKTRFSQMELLLNN
jgi:hypothetical protein